MLYFIRHALDDEAYVGSWSDVSILDSEVENVEKQTKYIKENLPITQIITSDIKRAKQTAEIIGKGINIPIIEDKNLREQNKGVLTGRLRSSLSKEELDLIKHQQIDTKFEGGETLIELYERIKKYLEIINSFDDNTLIVTHRGVINMIYYILNEVPLDMDKKKFGVDHLSIHEYDIEKMLIRRIK